MGLKDWFGGDKKKAEFREKVKEAVSDGKLTPERLAQLEAVRRELDTSEASDDRTQLRREVFNTAVGAVKAGGKLTPEQQAELERVQKFLALRDDQVDKTRLDLAYLRKATEVRHGPLPTVSPENAALRGLQLEPGELAHYCAAATFFSIDDTGPVAGQKVVAGTEYRPGSGKAYALPVKGVTPTSEGVFILSNQRFILKGGRTVGYPLKQPADVFMYREGMRLNFKKKQLLVQFRDEHIPDVVGTMLTRLLA